MGTIRPLNDAGEEYLRQKRLSRFDRSELVRVLRSENVSLFPGRVAGAGSDADRVTVVSPETERDHREGRLSAIFDLTSREAQVAVELLRGDPYSVIAERLGIGTETVRTFVRSIHRKTGISTTKRFIRVGRGPAVAFLAHSLERRGRSCDRGPGFHPAPPQ